MAYVAAVAPGQEELDLQAIWPTKSEARLPLLRRQMDRRFAAYPHAHATLHEWSNGAGIFPGLHALICHWHLQLADPIYRAFTVWLRQLSQVTLRDVNDDFLQAFASDSWSASTRLQLASKLLSAVCEAGLISSGRATRQVLVPHVTDAAVAYVVHLIEGIEYEGTAIDNPYMASVGIDRSRLEKIPSIRIGRKRVSLAEPFDPLSFAHMTPLPPQDLSQRDFRVWIPAEPFEEATATPEPLLTDVATVIPEPTVRQKRARRGAAPTDVPPAAEETMTPPPVAATAPLQAVNSMALDNSKLDVSALAAAIAENLISGWSAPIQAISTPSDAWFKFLTEKLTIIGGKPSKVSTYRSAYDDFIARKGPQWPTEARIAEYSKFCRDRLSGAYAKGRTAVLVEWRQWCLDRKLFALEVEDDAAAAGEDIAVRFTSSPSTTSLAAPVDGYVRLHPDDIRAIADASKESVSGALWGGEASEDYWATVTRHVIADYATSSIAERCKIDTLTAEEYVRKRAFPVFARPHLERLYSNILLRRRRLKGEHIDDIVDEVDELEIVNRQHHHAEHEG